MSLYFETKEVLCYTDYVDSCRRFSQNTDLKTAVLGDGVTQWLTQKIFFGGVFNKFS
jgi:hypothetical protein